MGSPRRAAVAMVGGFISLQEVTWGNSGIAPVAAEQGTWLVHRSNYGFKME